MDANFVVHEAAMVENAKFVELATPIEKKHLFVKRPKQTLTYGKPF